MAITQKEVKGTITTAYEKTLETPLSYSIQATQWSSVEEVRAAGRWPDDSKIVKMVNAAEVAKKRAEAIKASLDAAGIKAPTLEDDNTAIKETAKILMARNKALTQEQAEAQARVILGIGEDESEEVEA